MVVMALIATFRKWLIEKSGIFKNVLLTLTQFSSVI